MIAASSSDNQLRNFLRVPWRHRGKVAAFFLTVFCATALVNLLMHRTYRSEGELLLRLGRENMLLDPTATVASTPILTVQQSRENELNSVIEILRSPALLTKVVNAIGADAVLDRTSWHSTESQLSDSVRLRPATAADTDLSATDSASTEEQLSSDAQSMDAVRRLSKSLNVEAVRKSNVVQITYDARDPALAQAVVDRLIRYFLEDYIRLNRTPGGQEFLSQQTDTIRQRLRMKEDELRNLKDSTELAEPEGRRTIVVNRIGRLEDDLLQTSAQLASSEAEVNQLRQQLDSLPATAVTEQTVGFANEATDGMRQQLYALQIREQDLASRFTDAHPQLREVRQQIKDAQAVLKQEPPRTQTKTGPSKPYEEIKVQLLKDEPLLAALKAKTVQLTTDLTHEKQSLEKLNADELQIAQKQREVQLEEANYRKYADSLEQARIDRAMAEEGKSNVSIVQPATFDQKPIKPNALFNMALATVVGLLGGIGLAFAADAWNESVHAVENGHARINEPVLAR
jgi:polysaccharide biosynthesis protein PslE